MLEIEKENAIRRDARKEGLEEGHKEERREAVRKTKKILQDLNLSPEEIQIKLMDAYPEDEKMIREIMKTV